MKKLLILALVISSCGSSHEHDNELYWNKTYVVVSKGASDDVTHDKFSTPVSRKLLLARSVSDTNRFIEWDLSYSYQGYYNTNVGDTLHFHHIRKDREFVIKSRNVDTSKH